MGVVSKARLNVGFRFFALLPLFSRSPADIHELKDPVYPWLAFPSEAL